MGRGRAKAKQRKVARDLKYRTYEPDLEQLQREVSGDGQGGYEAGRDDELDAKLASLDRSDTDEVTDRAGDRSR